MLRVHLGDLYAGHVERQFRQHRVGHFREQARDRAVDRLALADVRRQAGRIVGHAVQEVRVDVVAHAIHVVQHEHLAVDLDAGADADHRDADLLGDDSADAPRHAFEHEHDGAGRGNGFRVVDDGLRLLRRVALHLVAADQAGRLRRQAKVADHRNAGVSHRLDLGDHRPAAFELHRFAPALFHEPHAVGDRLFGRHVVRPERHVADQHRVLHTAAHRAHEHEQLVEADRHRVRIAEHHVRRAVADKNRFDPRFVEQLRGGEIVGGEHGDLFAGSLPFLQVTEIDFGALHGSFSADWSRDDKGLNPTAPVTSRRMRYIRALCRCRRTRRAIVRESTEGVKIVEYVGAGLRPARIEGRTAVRPLGGKGGSETRPYDFGPTGLRRFWTKPGHRSTFQTST